MIKMIRKLFGLCQHRFITLEKWNTHVSCDFSYYDEKHILKECTHCGRLKHYKFRV